MGANLVAVWSNIKEYLKEGISIFPVHNDKTPAVSDWNQFRKRIITEVELWEILDKKNSEAVAIVGGVINGNLEIIDIDEKYKPGISEQFFNDLNLVYPELLARLRIHETPSGGFHILYRCTEPVEGNKKLAGRLKTDAELIVSPKPKVANFIETRGDGGYVVAPPALGYTVRKNTPIPTLSPEERIQLLDFARSYNLLPAEEKKEYKPTKQESEYYAVNPFEDFNNRCDPSFIEKYGWKLTKQNSNFLWYTRPGKQKGISASFNLSTRFFYIFTSSTELDPKGYSPVNLLNRLEYNNKTELYAYLINNGYGKIHPKVEQRIVRKAAVSREPAPANLSPEAAKEYEERRSTAQEHLPYGAFWFESTRGGVQIDREKLIQVFTGLGFRLYLEELVRIELQIIHRQTKRDAYDAVKDYIHEDDEFLLNDIYNAYESFIEAHGKFTLERLPILTEEQVLHDDKDTCYKCFQNFIVKITAQKVAPIQYTDVTQYIAAESIIPRQFVPVSNPEASETLYPSFLRLALGKIDTQLLSIIGFLSHHYKDETTAYFILLAEQVENPKDGGGSGKNIFSSMFSNISTVHSIAGTQVKDDSKFLQSWGGQRIVVISDLYKTFNFEMMKEPTSGSAVVKKLFKDEYTVPVHLMPKFILSTQFSIDIKDGGIRRRAIILEFTDFFTKAGGVDVHFDGRHFPKDFTGEDWAAFDSLCVKGVQVWLQQARKLQITGLTASGWAKQFEQTYGHSTAAFIREYFPLWVQAGEITNEVFKGQLTAFYSENSTPINYRPSMYKINEGIRAYCEAQKVIFNPEKVIRNNGILTKVKTFELIEKAPF